MKNKRITIHKSSYIEKVFEVMVLRSWWVLLFLLLGYVAVNHTIKKRENEIKQVETRIAALENKKYRTEVEQEDLLLNIHSQSDPSWIELILMKELGVVPEGYMKIHFTNN
jgi:hypothetical protein